MAKSLALRFLLLAALIPLAGCKVTSRQKVAALRAVTTAILNVVYVDEAVAPASAESVAAAPAKVACTKAKATKAPRAGKKRQMKVAVRTNDAKPAVEPFVYIVESNLATEQGRVVTVVRVRAEELKADIARVRAALAAAPRPLVRI